MFTDTTDQPEVMFGLVHLVESFEIRAQLEAMIEVLPTLEAEAPDWVRTLHYRILNHDEARATYAALLVHHPTAGIARAILEEIARDEGEPLRSSALAVLGGR